MIAILRTVTTRLSTQDLPSTEEVASLAEVTLVAVAPVVSVVAVAPAVADTLEEGDSKYTLLLDFKI